MNGNGMFSDRVKKVLQLSRSTAVSIGNDQVGTEHLLLGMIQEGSGIAIAALKKMEVDIKLLATDIEDVLRYSNEIINIGNNQLIPFTGRAKAVLQISANESRDMNEGVIGIEHLLLAIVKATDSIASATLSRYDVTYDALKEKILEIKDGLKDDDSRPFSKDTPMSNRSVRRRSKTPILEHY